MTAWATEGDRFPGPRLILYTVFIFGAVLAVFGNLLVMISILYFKQLHSPTNFLIASLACADFLLGVTVMPFSTVRSVESCWYFGQRYCQLHSCFEGSFCYASIYHLCFISLDRYIAVTDPLVYPARFTVSVSGMCIASSWLFSIIFSFSLFGTGANAAGLEDVVSALTCVGGCQIAVNQSWVLVSFLVFFIPTLVMITVYFKIFLIAEQQARKIENLNNKTGRCSDSFQDRVAKRERKAARTLGVAVIAFLVSWLPYFLDAIIDAFLGFITPTYVYEILVWIAYYNSAMNPLIYAFFYPWFRKAIKLIVTGKVLRANSSTVNLFSGLIPGYSFSLFLCNIFHYNVNAPVEYLERSWLKESKVAYPLNVWTKPMKCLSTLIKFLITSLALTDLLVEVVLTFSIVRRMKRAWDFSSSLQAAAFSSQFLDRLFGLCGVTVMPFSMVRSVESCWYFGARFCALHSSCDVAFCYSFLFHLCFISIDRYVAVTDPLVYPPKFKVSVSGVCISISWILPIVYSGAVSYTCVSDDGMEELDFCFIMSESVRSFSLGFVSTLFYIKQ
ncbi:hypothetical protein E5288_WYG003324 [Bos mutus]|uniref:G-protein coupled receptors family 1 profile domain-containing protein n=1 Tax=Bos mutus TaxID=72004 RepID=A0A6B0S3F0_9CETA|nr:hypothetical protein [Bos mutus]